MTGTETNNRKLLKWAVLAVLLIGSFLFMLLSWNSGKYIRAYESISYRQIQKEDAELLVGNKYVIQPGQRGIRLTYYEMKPDGHKGELLSSRVLRKPQERIVVTGNKPESAVKADAQSTFAGYIDALKKKNYQKVVEESTPETMKGANADTLRDAYAATGEVINGCTIGNITLYRNDVWSEKQQENSYDSSGRTDLSKPRTLGTAAIVAVIDVDLDMSATRYKETLLKANAYMLLDGKQWKVGYFGPTRKVGVGQTKTIRQSYYGGDDVLDVTLESIVLYPDRFALLGHETNKSTSDYSAISSSLDNMAVTLQTSDQSVDQVSYFSTALDYSVDKGQTQSGMITYQPGITSGEVVYVKCYEADFDPVKIP
jgi:G5 domain